MARKKAFQLESFENGDYGAEIDGAGSETDEEEMEKEMEELRFLLQYQSQDLGEEEPGMMIPLEGREKGERKKSLAGRLLGRSA